MSSVFFYLIIMTLNIFFDILSPGIRFLPSLCIFFFVLSNSDVPLSLCLIAAFIERNKNYLRVKFQLFIF